MPLWAQRTNTNLTIQCISIGYYVWIVHCAPTFDQQLGDYHLKFRRGVRANDSPVFHRFFFKYVWVDAIHSNAIQRVFVFGIQFHFRLVYTMDCTAIFGAFHIQCIHGAWHQLTHILNSITFERAPILFSSFYIPLLILDLETRFHVQMNWMWHSSFG